jgi:hypothetical protein
MQGYVRVSPAGSNVPIAFSIGTNNGIQKPTIAAAGARTGSAVKTLK